MRIIEELMNRRWILKSQDPQLYYEIKDNAKELKKKLQEKFGYALIINPYLVKLEKIPGKAEGWMGITEFETLMEYQMFCYLLMLLEDKEAGERFILSNICEFIQVQLPKGELEWTSLRARRQLVRVLQYALKMGMIISREGDEDYFLKDETSDILYENTDFLSSKFFVILQMWQTSFSRPQYQTALSLHNLFHLPSSQLQGLLQISCVLLCHPHHIPDLLPMPSQTV